MPDAFHRDLSSRSSSLPILIRTRDMDSSDVLHQLKQQHQAYFPIVNDPALLTEYAVDFFGPEGQEPLLTHTTREIARSLLLKRCDQWADACCAQDRQAVFVQEAADYSGIGMQDLAHRLKLVLDVIENPETLLGYLAKAFGPLGPHGLAITDEAQWQEIDDLFLCRMPYPSGFPSKGSLSTASSPSTYQKTYRRGENVHILRSASSAIKAERIAMRNPSVEPLIAAENPPSSRHGDENRQSDETCVIEPEVLQGKGSQTGLSDQGLSVMQVAGLCALCVGAGAIGGLMLAGLGRGVLTKAGAEALGSIGTFAVGSLGRRVFTGPRGGRYIVTSTGTKSYNVA